MATALSPLVRRDRDETPSAHVDVRASWCEAFRTVRAETERRAAVLSAEDQVVQSMPDASPTKWHRAHTTWFFERFLLLPHLAGYRVLDERFAFLFNSYYVAAGPRHARPMRGLITRPGAAEVTAYRAHVDAAVERLVTTVADAELAAVIRVLEIGLHHEQQHQELLLTDILHAFAQNPMPPAYDVHWQSPAVAASAPALELAAGLYRIGFAGGGFCFDNEEPAHQVYLQDARIARTLVTNAEWLAFMADGGYTTPSLWLSEGWATVEAEGWSAPGYWHQQDGASRQDSGGQQDGTWHTVTLAGCKLVDPAAAVVHVSYYEADAFARWAGKHLPSEAEWEAAAAGSEGSSGDARPHDAFSVARPHDAFGVARLHDAFGVARLHDAFGVAWQWTRSAYLAYPGYRAAEGALGEYNGKFMINQMVLRGSSHATPAGHARASYRNFFPPSARWQFSGVRLLDYP